MSIVLKENEWAEEMIATSNIGSKPMETLQRVARYYLDAGYKKRSVEGKLEDFILHSIPASSIPEWSKKIDGAIKNAISYEAVNIDGIYIYKSELDKINTLDNKQSRRYAFAILCIAKFNDISRHTNTHRVDQKNADIMRMANINTSQKRRCAMKHSLMEQGMIRFARGVDDTAVYVEFVDDNGSDDDIAMTVTDFRNLGYQYLEYCGGDFYHCEHCGLVDKVRDRIGRRQKYCPECAIKIHTQQKVNSVMRIRNQN